MSILCSKQINWEFSGPPNSRSLRASAHTGVAISRIEAQFLVDEFRETAGENSLYDDRLPGIRWRFPHQCAHWFGMTRSNGPSNSNLSHCCVYPISFFIKTTTGKSGGYFYKRVIFRKAPHCGGEWSKAGPAWEAAGKRRTGGCVVPQEVRRQRLSWILP